MSFNLWRSLVDGTKISAIPDNENLHFNYDIQSQPQSDGQTIDPLVDQSGNDFDGSAIGPAEMATGEFNNNDVANLIGEDDGWSVSASNGWSDLEQPFTIYWVGELADSLTGRFQHIIRRDGNFQIRWDEGDTNWEFRLGNSLAGSSDRGVNMIGVVGDGSNSLMEEDRSETVSGDGGEENLDDDFDVGGAADESSDAAFTGFYGQLLAYNVGHDSETRNEVYDYLETQWRL